MTKYLETLRLKSLGLSQQSIVAQFCYHIQQDEQKRRATTMHINCKNVDQGEVDRAGDPAIIIEPDTGEIIKSYIFVGVMTPTASIHTWKYFWM